MHVLLHRPQSGRAWPQHHTPSDLSLGWRSTARQTLCGSGLPARLQSSLGALMLAPRTGDGFHPGGEERRTRSGARRCETPRRRAQPLQDVWAPRATGMPRRRRQTRQVRLVGGPCRAWCRIAVRHRRAREPFLNVRHGFFLGPCALTRSQTCIRRSRSGGRRVTKDHRDLRHAQHHQAL